MEDLCVTFERWHMGDGTYPPLRKGQKVNLAFCVQSYEMEFTNVPQYVFRQLKNSDYEFSGQIVRDFQIGVLRLLLVNVKEFFFYIKISESGLQNLEGQFLCGKGQLLIDYGIWSEYFCHYEKEIDIFYNFTVESIHEVAIPDKFIQIDDGVFSAPPSLLANDYDATDMKEIEDMEYSTNDVSFFLLDLKSTNEKVARTFQK